MDLHMQKAWLIVGAKVWLDTAGVHQAPPVSFSVEPERDHTSNHSSAAPGLHGHHEPSLFSQRAGLSQP